jgi:hypothetical protein
LVDDYLFVTTCPQKARFFLETMASGFPEYGCKISQEKTLTNFDHGIQIMNVVPPGQKCASSRVASEKALISIPTSLSVVWAID